MLEAKQFSQLSFGSSDRDIDLVAKHEEGNMFQAGILEVVVKLLLGLMEPCAICCINKEDGTIQSSKVIRPPAVGVFEGARVSNLAIDVLDADGGLLWTLRMVA